MKERPIIFDAESIKAILAGRKTQTRRVVNRKKREANGWTLDGLPAFSCPYGDPGDRLWVRETWATMWPDTTDNGMVYDDDHPFGRPVRDDECSIEYRADTGHALPGDWSEEDRDHPDCPKWRSPIHMPRWASRITLEVRSVRVERLQDISESDAIAEGAEARELYGLGYAGGQTLTDERNPAVTTATLARGARGAFALRWDTINAKRGHPWESNCWVWVVEFKVLAPEVKSERVLQVR